MSDDWSTFKRIGDDISFDDLVEFSAEDEVASSVLRDASSEGTSTQAGLQTRSYVKSDWRHDFRFVL